MKDINFKTAKSYLESGKPFKAKSNHREYTFIYCDDKNVYITYDCDSHFYYTETDFNKADFQFISFLPRKQFKVGDKVRITDDIKGTEGWKGVKDDFPNMKGEIIRIFNDSNGLAYRVGKIDEWRTIGAEYLISDCTEDTTEEETMPELDEIKKVFDEFVEKTNKLFE